VLTLATDYKVDALIDACITYMTDSMSVDTVCRLAVLAQQIGNKVCNHSPMHQFLYIIFIVLFAWCCVDVLIVYYRNWVANT
jgi:hypothetical protein